MKKFLLVFALVLVTATFVFAQTAAEKSAPPEAQSVDQTEALPAVEQTVTETATEPAVEPVALPAVEPAAESAVLPETTTVTIPATATTPAEALTLKGSIIDNQCACKQTPEQLSEFVKTHTKECALLPACAASGYSIFADNVLYKFDKESNVKVGEFLKQENNKLSVLVVAKKIGDELNLVSIDNQK